MAGGQILTVILLFACALFLLMPTAFGREFIMMALAFQIGQVVVALGLGLHVLRRRRQRDPNAVVRGGDRHDAPRL